MLVVLSPAKKLDFENIKEINKTTSISFIEKTKKLVKSLKELSADDLSKLMKISKPLGELNFKRYQNFKTPIEKNNGKPALFVFKGDTYVGFEADSISTNVLDYGQSHLRILSGLYGILKPKDLIHPYRLEMGTRFKFDQYKNLYDYWKSDLTETLNSDCTETKSRYVLNCASKEYFSAIDEKSLDVEVITPIFKDRKGDEYKMIGFHAKKARGMMARFVLENKITQAKELKKFNTAGYRYMPELSSDLAPVFYRD